MGSPREQTALSPPCSERGGLCMAVAAPDHEAVARIVQSQHSPVDMVEVRLDAMPRPDLPRLRAAIARPLLCTNRPAWEGGAFAGTEEERLALLHQAVAAGVDYVDLELRAGEGLRRELLATLAGSSTRMIISWHDFVSTPGAHELAAILDRQADSGAHVGKIVTMAHTLSDVRRVLYLLELAEGKKFSLIAFCMGTLGRVSRIVTLALGGFMTYAAPDGAEGTAPGQLTVTELRGLLRGMEGGR